jgi:hypothetical protein
MSRRCVLTTSGFSLGFASDLAFRSFLIKPMGLRFSPRLNRLRARACTISRSCSWLRSRSLSCFQYFALIRLEVYRTGQGRCRGRRTCGTFSSSSALDIKHILATVLRYAYTKRSEFCESVSGVRDWSATVYQIGVKVGDSYRQPPRRCSLRPPLSLSTSSDKRQIDGNGIDGVDWFVVMGRLVVWIALSNS